MNHDFQDAALSELFSRNLPMGQMSPQSAAELDQKVLREVKKIKRQTVAEINPGIYFIDLKVVAKSERF
jgi:hypothetical protein